jgi:hypothetical protein
VYHLALPVLKVRASRGVAEMSWKWWIASVHETSRGMPTEAWVNLNTRRCRLGVHWTEYRLSLVHRGPGQSAGHLNARPHNSNVV